MKKDNQSFEEQEKALDRMIELFAHYDDLKQDKLNHPCKYMWDMDILDQECKEHYETMVKFIPSQIERSIADTCRKTLNNS